MDQNQKPAKGQSQTFKFDLNIRTLFIIVFVILFGLTIFYGNQEFQRLSSEKPINEVLTAIKTGKIKKIERSGNTITAIYKNGERVSTKKEAEDSFRQILQESGIDPDDINVLVRTNEETSLLSTFIINVIPTILIIAFFIFIFRQSRSKRFSKKMSKITFKDVAGVDEAKKELEEIVDFLKNPKKYKKLGARPPKGVILVGPAGTGKTLLAKAVAGESNVPFFSVAGSEFMEMLVGIGAARVRDLFSIAKTSAPSIIFIDEIDAIGRTSSVSAMT